MKENLISRRNKFLIKFKNKFPDYEIIKFTKISDLIIVKDKDGFLHQNTCASNCLRTKFSIRSIIDKYSYIKYKINQLFPDLELLEYKSMKGKVIVRDNNGFTYSPQTFDLLQGHPVSIVSCNEKEKLFIFKANLKHNNKYTYLDFSYKNGKQKIEILCPIHEIFKQTIESHLFGASCSKCNKGGFSKESWIKRIINKKAYLYLIEIYNEDEKYLKVGITSKGINRRYRSIKNYKYNTLYQITDEPSKIFDLEREIIRKYKKNKVYPLLSFEGKNECFSIVIKEELINYIKLKEKCVYLP